MPGEGRRREMTTLIIIACPLIVIIGAVIMFNNTLYCHVFEREDVRRWNKILSIADKFEHVYSKVYVWGSVDVFRADGYEAILWGNGTTSVHYVNGDIYVVYFYKKGERKLRKILEKQIQG